MFTIDWLRSLTTLLSGVECYLLYEFKLCPSLLMQTHSRMSNTPGVDMNDRRSMEQLNRAQSPVVVKENRMTVASAVPSLTLAIISRQYLMWFGLQKIFERVDTVRIVVHPHLSMTPDAPPAEPRPDVFILDMETEQDAIGTINQIRESAPTSKIVLLSGFEDKDRTRDAFEYGVDGIILKVQTPAVMLAVIKGLYASICERSSVKPHEGVDLNKFPTSDLVAELNVPPVWCDGLTERKKQIVALISQGLSNKDIADRLYISECTVRHHLTSIFYRIGVPNRKKLLIYTNRFPCSGAMGCNGFDEECHLQGFSEIPNPDI